LVKVGVNCNSCNAQFAVAVSSKLAPPRWARKLWSAALKAGWVRREQDFAAFCSNCKAHLNAPSNRLTPLEPMRFVTLLECEGCGIRFQGQDAIIETNFARGLRNAAREVGWKYISFDSNKSFHDFCSDCMPNALKNKRKHLMRNVWSQSTVKVALDLGVSDKTIEKQCKRLNIPKPPRGFWAKWDAGHIEDCRALIPQEVIDLLGEEFLNDIYPLNPSN
jgi:hypothetical protein